MPSLANNDPHRRRGRWGRWHRARVLYPTDGGIPYPEPIGFLRDTDILS
jgi:hypothetical protein